MCHEDRRKKEPPVVVAIVMIVIIIRTVCVAGGWLAGVMAVEGGPGKHHRLDRLIVTHVCLLLIGVPNCPRLIV